MAEKACEKFFSIPGRKLAITFGTNESAKSSYPSNRTTFHSGVDKIGGGATHHLISLESHMQNLDHVFVTLKTYVSRISWMFVLFETAVGLAFGSLLGAHFSGVSYTGPLWALGLTYLALIFIKLSTQRLFPSALVEELQAKDLLASARKQISRKDLISEFTAHSIAALNSQTCAISLEAENELCSQAVSDGLAQVIEPLISRPHYIFDCNESAYSIACLVYYRAPEPVGFTQDFIILRDDHEISAMLSTDLLWKHTAKGQVLDLQKAVQRCYNDNAFVCESFNPNGVPLSIIASPIPLVCETSEASGVLIFITRCGHRCPTDVENTFRIFGRIIANWLSKYSECVSAKEANKRTQAPDILPSPDS